jgi:hypothetical protein
MPSARRCLVLSLQWEVTPFRGCEAPRVLIFDGELTALVPTLLNLSWGKSFLPGEAYPMIESS